MAPPALGSALSTATRGQPTPAAAFGAASALGTGLVAGVGTYQVKNADAGRSPA